MERVEAIEDCVFCDIAAERAEASVVYRDATVLAFMDIRPVGPGHLLVVPIDHVTFLADVDEALLTRVFAIGKRLADALRRSGLPCEGVNLFLADGEAAGQEVPHTHLHVIPRTRDDGFRIDAAAWSERRPSRETLDETARAVRGALERMGTR